MNLQNDENWISILQFLPNGWEQVMKDTGLLTRKRNFKTEADLLRTLLLYLSFDNSLVVASTIASVSGLADCSDVALLKRLKNSADFFEYLNNHLISHRGIDYATIDIFKDYNVYAIDASVVSEPGSTGTDWRLHYSLDLATLKCSQYKVTRQDVGETFLNFAVQNRDLLLGDRVYGRYKSMKYVKDNRGDFIVRFMNKAFTMEDENQLKFDMYDKVKDLKVGEILEFTANIFFESSEKMPVRFCVMKKSAIEQERALRKVRRKMKKQQQKLSYKTLELHRYVILMTSLPESISAESILELYRLRWQVELSFKRLKSIFGLGHLPKKNQSTARAWLQGKIFIAMLTQLFLDECSLFSPWGYPSKRRDKVYMA